MYIQDLVNKDEVLIEAFKHPALKIKPRSKHRPDLDTALKAVIATLEFQVCTKVAQELEPTIRGVLDTQILLGGEWQDSRETGEWEAALDDAVEEAIEPWVSILSADWLGRNTISCGVQEENGVRKFCLSLGREVYKQLTYENKKTPAQILSNAGIVQADIEAMLENHLNLTEEDKHTMETEQGEELQMVIGRIGDQVGKDFDIMLVYDDFDLASDEDDGLAFGAGARLGIDEDDVRVLQGERMVYGDDTAQILVDKLTEYFTGKPKKATKPPKAPKTEKAVAASKPAKVETSATIEPTVLVALRDHGGAKDTDMAGLMGVSRATYNNWSNGKTECSPDEAKRTALRGVIVDKLNALHEALAAVDGTEPETVF